MRNRRKNDSGRPTRHSVVRNQWSEEYPLLLQKGDRERFYIDLDVLPGIGVYYYE